MPRIAYIGLSSPIFYDYNNKAKKTKNDTVSSPNPILESPFGLMLLYDEIWFLCKSLCPYNMRRLPYVKFIDQIYPEIDFKTINAFLYSMDEDKLSGINRRINPLSSYSHFQKALCVDSINARTDNHIHLLKIGSDFESYASSANLKFLLFDIAIMGYFNDILDIKIELITNSFTNQFLSINQFNNSSQLELTEALTIKNIPNYLTKLGPYHPIIEEAREDKYLLDFRKWISSSSSNLDINEVKDIVEEVQHSIYCKKEELFSNYFEPKTYYVSIGKTLFGVSIDFAFPGIPGLSAVPSIINDIINRLSSSELRWQGFVSDFDKMYSKTNK